MKHTGTIELNTKRLLLRPIKVADAQTMFDNWANDSEVTRFMTWQAHKTVDLTREIIASWASQYADPTYYLWAICLKDKPDEVIGTFSATKPDDRLKATEIGYCIGRKWWGQGITAEAFTEVIRLMFEQVGVNRIFAHHHMGNPNSGRVMEKCGLQKEGILRQADLDNQGRLIDKALYSILASDYFRNAMDSVERLR